MIPAGFAFLARPWFKYVALAGLVLALAGAAFIAWKRDRERYGDLREASGFERCEEATRVATRNLQTHLDAEREENRRLTQELFNEQRESEELAARLAAEAAADPNAADPGLGDDSRLRLDSIR